MTIEKETFKQWLQSSNSLFKVDKQSEKLVRLLGLWAFRRPDFEKEDGFFLEKGILLSGVVGTGKTEIMRKLREYMYYLQTPYRFNGEIVWHFSELYKEHGFKCFDKIEKGNWFFDELGLTDEQTGEPTKEIVNNYGNKIVVGKELILKRYNIFKNEGYQTHFTTNLNLKQIFEIYGERCYSRLTEMCNFMPYIGKDRRLTGRPLIHSDENNYKPPSPEKTQLEKDEQVKSFINDMYLNFINTNNAKYLFSGMFEIMKGAGITVANDEELRILKLEVEDDRLIQLRAGGFDMEQAKEYKKLIADYAGNNIDKKEKDWLWSETKRVAVLAYFQKLKQENKTKIF